MSDVDAAGREVPPARDPLVAPDVDPRLRPVLHRAARLEDLLNRLVAALLIRRSWRPRVIAYTGYGTDGWVRVLARVLLAPPEILDHPDLSVRGWRHFLSAKLSGVPVELEVGGRRHVLESGRGGYLDEVAPVDLPPGWTEGRLRVRGGDVTTFDLRVVGPDERLGVISDIDDTVLVTALPRPFLAFWNTFVRREESRHPVPGMPELFRTVLRHHPGAFVVYVSTGAWNLAPALQRFLRRRDFPAGPLLLTDWGPTPDGWFRSGPEHKRATLRRLLDELPQLRWVLVGDDGQHDPQLYDEIVWARPDDVRVVAIRQLAAGEQVLTHGSPVPLPAGGRRRSGGGVPWVRAPNGHSLVTELRREGLADGVALGPDDAPSATA